MTGILVGAAITATRFVIDQTHPASLALLRYAIALLCLLPLALVNGPLRFERRDLLPVALLGIIQFGILIVLLNYSLQFIPAGRAALIFATMPLLAMAFGAARGSESLTIRMSVSVPLTILGVAFALGDKALGSSDAVGAWRGELAAFGSALSGAVCSVLYRPYLRKYRTLSVSAFAMIASVAFLALAAATEGFFDGIPRFSAIGWSAVLFIGISSGVGYYLWLWALRRANATSVTVFLALSPVTATALGAVLVGETVSWPFVLGLAFVALGLWIAETSSGSRARAAH